MIHDLSVSKEGAALRQGGPGPTACANSLQSVGPISPVLAASPIPMLLLTPPPPQSATSSQKPCVLLDSRPVPHSVQGAASCEVLSSSSRGHQCPASACPAGWA